MLGSEGTLVILGIHYQKNSCFQGLSSKAHDRFGVSGPRVVGQIDGVWQPTPVIIGLNTIGEHVDQTASHDSKVFVIYSRPQRLPRPTPGRLQKIVEALVPAYPEAQLILLDQPIL